MCSPEGSCKRLLECAITESLSISTRHVSSSMCKCVQGLSVWYNAALFASNLAGLWASHSNAGTRFLSWSIDSPTAVVMRALSIWQAEREYCHRHNSIPSRFAGKLVLCDIKHESSSVCLLWKLVPLIKSKRSEHATVSLLDIVHYAMWPSAIPTTDAST